MIEEAAAAVSFSEALDLLDVVGNGLQQVLELHLQQRKKKKECGRKEVRCRGECMKIKEI